MLSRTLIACAALAAMPLCGQAQEYVRTEYMTVEQPRYRREHWHHHGHRYCEHDDD